MSRVEEFLLRLLAVIMLMAVMGTILFLEGCSDDDDSTGPALTPKTPLAYIYATDSTAGTAARTLLAGYDYTVRMVSIDSVESEDFTGDSLVLVDHNTEDQWDNPDAATAILNSGKPVIAMGEGGYDLYGELGLNIGRPHGAHDVRAVAKVTVVCSCLVTTPHTITVPGDSLITFYSSDCQVVDILEAPASVTIFAFYADDDRYSELVEEQDRFFLWGFGGSVTDMTTTGSNMFVNTIDYMLSK